MLPILALAAAVALFAFAPRLIRAATVRLIPPEQAEEIGDRMLIALIEAHGPPCAGPDGERALGRLAAALDPSDPPRLRVMDLGAGTVAALPGRTILIDPDGARHGYARRGCRAGRQRARRPTLSRRWFAMPVSLPTSATSSAATSRSGRWRAPPNRRAGAAPTAAAGWEGPAPALADSDWIALRAICA